MITYADICDQVAQALRSVPGATVESYKEIGESIGKTPTLHVYPTGAETGDEDVDRTSFSTAVRVTTMTIKIDGYARPVSHIRHDIPAQIELADYIDNVLCSQESPLYGLTSIQAHHWSWERGVIEYAEKKYAAVTFTLKLTIF